MTPVTVQLTARVVLLLRLGVSGPPAEALPALPPAAGSPDAPIADSFSFDTLRLRRIRLKHE